MNGKSKTIIRENLKINEDKLDFIAKCENNMISSTNYDRHLFKESFKKL